MSMTMHENVSRDQTVTWRDRALTFNTSCYGCHVSQIETDYDPASDGYRTTRREPGINCETCHGPSGKHVRPYEAARKNGGTPPVLGLLKPVGSMFDALRKHDVGMIGIKPFASGNLFASRGTPDSPTSQDDDQRAFQALRYVLCCDVLAASIPGLITVDQLKNAAAIKERRQFETAEALRYERLAAAMWHRLPPTKPGSAAGSGSDELAPEPVPKPFSARRTPPAPSSGALACALRHTAMSLLCSTDPS